MMCINNPNKVCVRSSSAKINRIIKKVVLIGIAATLMYLTFMTFYILNKGIFEFFAN